jgi:ParB family chromosome partitioning protein
MGHAKAILPVDGIEKQLSLQEQIIEKQLSVREAEQLAQHPEKAEKYFSEKIATQNCYIEMLQEKIQHRLGTKVTFQGKGKRGKISIDYYSLEDLDRILELLGISSDQTL